VVWSDDFATALERRLGKWSRRTDIRIASSILTAKQNAGPQAGVSQLCS